MRDPDHETRFLASGLVALFLLAATACGDDEPEAGGGRRARRGRCGSAYFGNVTHAPALIGEEEGIFAEALGAGRRRRVPVLQRRHRGDRGVVLRRDRRQPSSGRTRRSTASPSPRGKRSGSSPARRRAAPSLVVRDGIDVAGRSRGDHAGHAVARQHAGRGAPLVVGRPGLRDRPRPAVATVSILPAGERRHADDVPGRRHRRGLGPRAVGHAPGARGRRQVLVDERRAVAGRRVRHDPSHRRTPTT